LAPPCTAIIPFSIVRANTERLPQRKSARSNQAQGNAQGQEYPDHNLEFEKELNPANAVLGEGAFLIIEIF